MLAETLEGLQALPEMQGFWNHPAHLDQLIWEVKALARDGLDPERYEPLGLTHLRDQLLAGVPLAECQSRRVLRTYVSALKDLHFGRVDPQAEELVWYAERTPLSLRVEQLAGIALAGLEQGIHQGFESARPLLAAYRDLRKALALARQTWPASWTQVGGGALLRAGDSDPRVIAIKQRLREGGYLPSLPPGEIDNTRYGDDAAAAVLAFQRMHGIKDDGVMGPDTVREMNIQPAARIDQLRVNLERLRWFARDLETEMLLVDIAGAVVSYLRDGEVRLLSRAQAGQPRRETPPLRSRVTHVTVNPTWTVPPTIFRNDVLPAVRKDIGYLADNRIRVLDYAGNELDPDGVDWHNPGQVILRQDAGPDAALGQVVIRFPNPVAVFLHDTPRQDLFDTSGRFYSSGCVRVENALTLTDLLFEGASEEAAARLARVRAEGSTVDIDLPSSVPLVMFYWTAFADDRGEISFRPDIYARDERLVKLLDSGG